MAKAAVTRSIRDDHQKNFLKIFNGLTGKHSRWEIWEDFVTLTAIEISNSTDKVNATERTKMYQTIISKYSAKERDGMAEMLAEVVMGMEQNPDQDFLGSLYMMCELGNDHAGQFFTPYDVCRCMAEITFNPKLHPDMEGFISVSDPACGAGATLLAFLNVCKRRNICYHKLKFVDGLELPVSIKFVDEGGHFTQEVRQRCHDRIGKKVFCIKGFPGSDRPFTGPPKQVKITVQNRYIGMCWQYQLGVDAGKQIIMDDLKVQEPGPRYCHFPRRDDYGLGYFNGLLSEHLIYKEGHRNPWQWDKISGHERNEPLDCRNYAIAAYKVLPKDLDAIDRALKRLRGKAPEALAAPVINIQQPVSRPQPSPGRRRENFLDDW